MVLIKPEAPSPTALINALRSRGLAVRVVNDEPVVMSLFAEKPAGRRVLIVAEPGGWDRLAELICAVQTYHHEVLCWQYAHLGNGRQSLARLDQHVRGPGPSPAADGRSSAAGSSGYVSDAAGPVGRIMRRRRNVDALLTRVPGKPLSTREVVTQQELTMLLGPMPGEAG